MTGIKVLLAVLCLLIIPGCGDKGGSAPEAPPEDTTPPAILENKLDSQQALQVLTTPEETVEIKPDLPKEAPQKAGIPLGALENMRFALVAGDKQAFLNCFDLQGTQEEMIGAFYEFSVVASQYDKAMRKAYGDDAVKQATDGSVSVAPFEDENWLEDVTIRVEGDTATAIKAGQGESLRLLKRDGQWKIDATSMLGEEGVSDQDMEQLTSMFQLMTKAITDVSQKVGQDGYTAEKINQELSQTMMMAMMQASGAPALPSP